MSDFPGELPFTELYLIVSRGEWPVAAEINEAHAVNRAEAKAKDSTRSTQIWRVTAIEVEELELQHEVIRRSLVPKGTSVSR